MALFLATHHNRVDKKGRVSVPAQFRTAIADQSFQGIVVFPSHKVGALEGFSMAQMEELSSGIDSFEMFSDAHDDLATTIFGSAVPLPFDGEGRIVLPKELSAHAGIDDQAAFVGLGRKFQIWHPEALATHQAAAYERMREKGQTLPARSPAEGGK
ncbi:MAG: division/cell wall cluster transcriptional repressor MraZ [Alphaproteobacteria bacterium]|nr:division/cell wall cluster transcriptional repressor MraZ [Alphaproteobacteria bacterium SS10]